MAEDMNIILKPKYSNFIKIIENYENIEKNIILDSNNSSNSNEPNISNISSHEDKINIIVKKDINNSINSNDNKYQMLKTQQIFKKLHSLISKHTKYNENNYINSINISNNVDVSDKQQINVCDKNNNANNEKKQNNSYSDAGNYIKKKKKTKKKHIKKNKVVQDEEYQKQKLELLYEKKINQADNNYSYDSNNSNNSNKNLQNKSKNTSNEKNNKRSQYKDDLKKTCKQFEEKCLMESTRGFNVKDELYYINMDLLSKNIAQFNSTISANYESFVFYRSYKDQRIVLNSDKKIGWMEITKKGEHNISSINKYLSSSLRLFESASKFRKNINGTKVRAFKSTFYVYKTNIKIDIMAITKEVFN